MSKEQWSYWKLKLEPVIISKVEEWKILGYPKVTSKDVWELFLKQLEKQGEDPQTVRSHQMVADLFRLKVSAYMDNLTSNALKEPNATLNTDLFNDVLQS